MQENIAGTVRNIIISLIREEEYSFMMSGCAGLLHDINTTAAESMEIFMQLPCTDSAERKSSDGTHS